MRPIPGFEQYEITRLGRVWSNFREGQWLKGVVSHRGYLYVSLFSHGRESRKAIHRLVLETYVGPCPKDMECRHLNGNSSDNRLKNLKWGTMKENRKDKVKHKKERIRARPKYFTKKQSALLCMIYPPPTGRGLSITEACNRLDITIQAGFSRLRSFKSRFPEAWEQLETARRISQRHRLELRAGAMNGYAFECPDAYINIKEKF